MSKSYRSPASLSQRTGNMLRIVMTLGSLLSVAAGPALGQNGAGAQQGQSNPIVGRWEMQMRLQDGATMHQFDEYGPDGSWRQTSINVGGRSNGIRTQTWGNYSVQAAGNNTYRISFQTTGFAPMQVCTQGVGCTQLSRTQTFANSYVLVDRNHLRSLDRQQLITARVAQIPAELTAQLPATKMNAGAPPISTGGYPSNGGRSGGSTYHVPGQGGTCDNLQQQRICNLNDGYLYTGQDGCQHCSSGAGR